MKKTMIAGAGIAALAMAALPFAGVFATSSSVSDTVTLTVGTGCTMTTESHAVNGEYNLGIVGATASGAAAVLGGNDGVRGTDMMISCNHANGWTLSVNATALHSDAGNEDDDINFGAFVDSGDASVWSVKLAGNGVISGYRDFSGAKTGSNETVLSSDGSGISAATVTPYYKAYVTNQVAGTYTGEIVYTFTDNGNN